MNTSQNPSRPARWKGPALALALASVPITAFALSSFDNVEIKDPYNGTNTFFANHGALAVGWGHSFNSSVQNTLAVGTNHSFSMSGPSSAAIGSTNSASASSVLIAGTNNSVSGDNSAAMGKGLIVYDQGSVAVGEYNDPTEYAGEAFVVGIGASGPGNSKNGFVVLKDGSVIIPEPQGDVPVGIYQ